MTTMGLVTRVAALAVFGLGCMALGTRCAGPSGPDQATAPQRPTSQAVTHLSNEDRAELRRALADEVRRAVAAALPAAAAPAPAAVVAANAAPLEAEPATTASASAVAAHDTAERVVKDAIARGSWRPEDGQALRATLAEMDQPAAAQTLGELARAVNTGQLQIIARDRPMF